MSNNVVLGVDVGSSSVKTVAVDSEGRVLAEGSAVYPTTHPRAGWAEQDAADWHVATIAAIRECLGEFGRPEVAAVAVDGPAHNFALLDEAGKVVAPVIHWSDLRSAPQTERLAEEAGQEIFQISLQRVNPSWSLSQLAWIGEERPEVLSTVKALLVTKDYVRFRLTGQKATDPYDAVGTQMYDVAMSDWSERLCSLVGVPIEIMPTVLAPDDRAGAITEEAAKETGLPPRTPVLTGSGDTVSEALAVGATSPADTVLKLGTSGTVLAVADQARPDPRLLTYPHVVPGMWVSMAATNSAAGTMGWLRKVFLTDSAIPDDLVSLTILAEGAPPGADGLLFHPFLMGERSPYWDPSLRAAFTGITASHGLAHFIRAVLEGVAFSLRDGLETIEDNGVRPTNLRLIGGGARSDVWAQVIADVLARPVERIDMSAPAYGTALLAGVGIGWFTWDELPQPDRSLATVFSPKAETAEMYDTKYGRYLELVSSLKAGGGDG